MHQPRVLNLVTRSSTLMLCLSRPSRRPAGSTAQYADNKLRIWSCTVLLARNLLCMCSAGSWGGEGSWHPAGVQAATVYRKQTLHSVMSARTMHRMLRRRCCRR
jgi:hypothetical protein